MMRPPPEVLRLPYLYRAWTEGADWEQCWFYYSIHDALRGREHGERPRLQQVENFLSLDTEADVFLSSCFRVGGYGKEPEVLHEYSREEMDLLIVQLELLTHE